MLFNWLGKCPICKFSNLEADDFNRKMVRRGIPLPARIDYRRFYPCPRCGRTVCELCADLSQGTARMRCRRCRSSRSAILSEARRPGMHRSPLAPDLGHLDLEIEQSPDADKTEKSHDTRECCICGWSEANQEEYYEQKPWERPHFIPRHTEIFSCGRCGRWVCSGHCRPVPSSGYSYELDRTMLCRDCEEGIETENAARWKEEFGDAAGHANPYAEAAQSQSDEAQDYCERCGNPCPRRDLMSSPDGRSELCARCYLEAAEEARQRDLAGDYESEY